MGAVAGSASATGEPKRRTRLRDRKGSALLGVIWLSVALTAIAFTLSRTVRSELDRASLNVDSARAYYLAKGGIERTIMRMARPMRGDRGDPNLGFLPGQRWMRLSFPEGEVVVEIAGEGGKLNINQAPPESLARVLTAAGLAPSIAAETAGRIAAARAPSRNQLLDPTSSGASSLLRRPASFKELEELLLLPGMTTEVLFGTYGVGTQGQWFKTGGLHRHLSVYGGAGVDANYASPEVLRAAGLAPGQIASLLELRESRPLRPEDLGSNLMLDQTSAIRVTGGGGGIAYTLWSRAILHGGRARRSVGALVQRSQTIGAPPIRIVRWYDAEF